MDWMNVVRWIVGGATLAFGAFIAIGNWTSLLGAIITKGNTSFINFAGGVLGVVGILIIPLPGRLPWVWVPLVADWGCLPLWTCAGISALRKRMKQRTSA